MSGTNLARAESPARGDKEEAILDAVIALLGQGGIAAVSMRAVAREANVALGLMNYYFNDKTSLIAAALRRLGEADAELVAGTDGGDPEQQLRAALRGVVDDDLLRAEYLALRLHLWSLAPIDPVYAEINHQAQLRYRAGLIGLIAAARPDLDAAEVERRAADILIIQNGMWLTALLVDDPAAIARSVATCEQIATS